ncbi:NPCBM/NEW2 domain-containing protein [Streptomyces sp. H39-S7]|uniref:NPCBM/NEW2 domain-containing protein n=1 Tax=Streptomyces sp. H39-S7 TaxID=3004357 RepID=UPI0022AF6FB2|nr:NPCBM/NEW2 domain-containing protein [Streptomyces sp. H39-S7]MCZ4123317.1 NPCBM/NEW2 domain-containing protein [Streptomyces sp. H39-S7]
MNPFTEYTFAYKVPADWKYFRATIGIDINSKYSVTGMSFQIYLDDDAAPVAEYTLKMFESQDIKVPISGASKIKLYTANTTPRESFVRATWGDARLTND